MDKNDLIGELAAAAQPVLTALAGGTLVAGLPTWVTGVCIVLAYFDAQFLKLHQQSSQKVPPSVVAPVDPPVVPK